MIKVKLKELEEEPCQYLSLDDDYIPFSLKIGNNSILPETLYVRNIYGENFIEFRFNKDTRSLYEVTLVAFQPNGIFILDDTSFKQASQGMFSCIIEDDSELDISKPMQVFRSYNTFGIVWNNNDLHYFSITANCILGIDKDNELSAVILTFLSNNQIEEVIGR